MTSLFFWLTLWATTAPISYFLVRRDYRNGNGGKWTRADRIFWSFFCLLYGPVMLAMVIVGGVVVRIANTDWAKGEARW